ncbi:MAG TPA: BatA domain-containing protein, partial [Flavisolibacter sp.]|nr:BatA domain-containing protein [Flavisolibacter sp.]
MNIQFQYPQAFWLLALIPFLLLLFLVYQSWKRKARKKIGDVHLVKELSKNHSRTKTIIKFSLVAIAFACGCIALANPRI